MAPISQLQWIWHSDDAWHPDDAIGMNVAQYAGSGDGKWADSRQPSYYFIRYLSLETKPSAAWLQIYSGCGVIVVFERLTVGSAQGGPGRENRPSPRPRRPMTTNAGIWDARGRISRR